MVLRFQRADLGGFEVLEGAGLCNINQQTDKKPPWVYVSLWCSILKHCDQAPYNLISFSTGLQDAWKISIQTSPGVLGWENPHNVSTICPLCQSKTLKLLVPQHYSLLYFQKGICGRRLCALLSWWLPSELKYLKSDRAVALCSCCSLSIH